jgi:hypothetical protein
MAGDLDGSVPLLSCANKPACSWRHRKGTIAHRSISRVWIFHSQSLRGNSFEWWRWEGGEGTGGQATHTQWVGQLCLCAEPGALELFKCMCPTRPIAWSSTVCGGRRTVSGDAGCHWSSHSDSSTKRISWELTESFPADFIWPPLSQGACYFRSLRRAALRISALLRDRSEGR